MIMYLAKIGEGNVVRRKIGELRSAVRDQALASPTGPLMTFPVYRVNVTNRIAMGMVGKYLETGDPGPVPVTGLSEAIDVIVVKATHRTSAAPSEGVAAE